VNLYDQLQSHEVITKILVTIMSLTSSKNFNLRHQPIKICISAAYFSIALFSHMSIADEDTEHRFYPAVLHLEGVGNIYAAGIRSKNVGDSDLTVTAGIGIGDVKAAALNISDIELPFIDGVISSTSILITEATLDTQYIRGAKALKKNNEMVFEQSLSGIAQNLRYQEAITEDTSWYINASLSQVEVGGYATDKGDDIDINMHLFKPITSFIPTIGYQFDERPNNEQTGLNAKIELNGNFFRAGDSTQGQVNYAAGYTFELDQHTLITYLRGSHAYIINREKDYDTHVEVKALLGLECDAITNNSEQDSCLILERDITDSIVQSAIHGSANSLGGAYGLRSYSEQYVKASNTLLEGAELTLNSPWQVAENASVAFVFFAEAGQADEQIENLADNSLYSYGVGIRTNYEGLPIRLETANGSNNEQSWFLTAGTAW
jgi:hypothetical protein